MCVSVFIPSCRVCVYSSMYHLHQPPHQASSCLSVCPYSRVHVCVCTNTLQGQVSQCFASHFSRDPSLCPWRSRPCHPHRASFCPPQNYTLPLGWAVQMVRGLETGDTYYTCKEPRQLKIVIKWNQDQRDHTVPLLTSVSALAAVSLNVHCRYIQCQYRRQKVMV